MAEVTLVTDKDHAVPVKVERSGVRSVLFGAGAGRPPELRFMSPTADIQVGDLLVTSGIDGTYPPGLAVARVATVERDTGQMFARITVHAARRRRPQRAPARARAGGGAAAAARGARSRPTPRRSRGAAARHEEASGDVVPTALARAGRPRRDPAARQAVVHRAHARRSRCSRNLLPLAGTALALRPDFLALVLLYWCIQEPRYVGVGVAWASGC